MIKIYRYDGVENRNILSRGAPSRGVTGAVRDILAGVRAGGDRAVKEYTLKFDGADVPSPEMTDGEIARAVSSVEPKFIGIMKKAAKNIEAFHRCQLRTGFVTGGDGIVLGQRVLPLERVGIYVPGGTASYPSTVLMDCIPAKIAGVREIVIATPPSKDGSVDPGILAAAKIAGADRIFRIGGAQAIAAMAYGTETVPRVDKIAGPGNAFVAEAKRQVYGQVAIDMIAGPSEILVIADGTCSARVVAADMLSQAEHDKMASAVLVTDSPELAREVADELERQLASLPRREIARASLDGNGKIIVVDSILKAIEIANEIAPEHLEICVDNPFDYLDRVRNAGSVFLGKSCPEALGDYFAGPNHTLPTMGTARFSSPLAVDDFVKRTSFTYYSGKALSEVSGDIAYFAEKEGLSAHARSVEARAGNTKAAGGGL